MSEQSSKHGSDPQASSMPSIYDTYLCREPADGVPMLIRNGPDEYTASMRTLQRSADYFAERDQARAVERLQLEMAKVHMKYERWERAARVLTPLWQTLSWRRAGWWQLLEEVDWALRDCASRVRNIETMIAVDWELWNSSLTPKQDWDYNFSRLLDGLKPLDSRPRSIIRAENILSCVSATFAFNASEGNIGEKLQSQLAISSRAQKNSAPIVISRIKVAFEGTLGNLSIFHESGEEIEAMEPKGSIQIHQVPLQRSSSDSSSTPSSPVTSQKAKHLVGYADLTLAPSVVQVFSLDHIPRDVGDVEAASVTLCMTEDDFDLEVVITEDEQMHQEYFWIPSRLGPSQKRLKSGRTNAVKILPKPPKMRIETGDLESTCFTDEAIAVDLLVTNGEDDEADIILDARLLGPPGTSPEITWISDQEGKGTDSDTATEGPLHSSDDPSLSKAIGKLASSSSQRHSLRMQATSEAADYVLEIRARYHLLSDPETPISKGFAANISIALPFEVSYSFTPMIHPEPWPSYFDVENFAEHPDNDAGEGIANGLAQRWSLTSRLYSLANVPLTIEMVEPHILEIHEAARCKILPATENISKLSVLCPKDIQERSFVLEAQKTDLEDHRSTFLNLMLEVRWRQDSSQSFATVTHLAVPELVIPFGEPRVLACARNGDAPLGVVYLEYLIENPSMYTLTFNLTMETSEEFAFSGAKNVSVQLVPLSRHTVRYSLMPLMKGVWISPQFRVFDTHFRKTLKVNATEGMRTDKRGISIWVDADG